MKQAGFNGFGPWVNLVEDLVGTTYDLAQHALKCRRMKKNISSIWGEIAWQACRASFAARGTYEIFRLRSEIKETIESDFWLVGIVGLRKCMKKDTEILINMDYAELDRQLDLMNKY